MRLDLNTLGKTTHNKYAGVIRIFLGGMFVMTGSMKLFVPSLRAAFTGQLQAAGIPFHEFNLQVVPPIEVLVGLFLLIGIMSRLGALTVVALMAVATYVHLAVNDPTLFPLQPEPPVIPIMMIVLSEYLMFAGGGAWSWDLKNS